MDLTILLPALLLAVIGVAMVYSATYAKDGMPAFYLKQIVWIALGLIAMIFFASFNFQVLIERYSQPAYWVLLVLLAVLLAAGEQISGSKRWIFLGPFGFQPSEFAKVATTLVLAKYLAARQDKVREWQTVMMAFLIGGIPMVLILREPDLGTALLFFPLVFALLYTVGVPVKRLFYIISTGVLASPLVWMLLKDYQRRRLMVFLNPNSDTLGAGYNVIQSKIAIGSGGFLGKGWLSGTQGQLKFVPEHHTDFIFSVMSEEWGFLGVMVLLLLFVLMLLQMLRIARSARDLGGSLTAVGLTTILFTQAVVNIGMATGILPVTGMTLPFISYGGSSMIACMSMLGILTSIWSSRKVK
ncbi:rod shape-determining protein RodA [candidate division FCPU426 bacterium]|nr:rod shape-determining protein RodA [candidate division FCPU426 bacterium]